MKRPAGESGPFREEGFRRDELESLSIEIYVAPDGGESV
jgi:hypothetical protein